MGGVVITSGQKKTTDWIDNDGNILDIEASPLGLINKGVKEFNRPTYVPTKEEIETKINLPAEPAKIPEGLTVQNASLLASQLPPIHVAVQQEQPIKTGFSIQQQIEQAEQHLADLKMLKKEEIARRKAELAELEAE